MTSGTTCSCLLCRIESQLMAQVMSADGVAYQALLSSTGNGLHAFPSPPLLLSQLRSSQAGPRSDDLFRELFAAPSIDGPLVESLMILAFLPTLHRTVRLVAKHQPRLSLEDVTQQAMSLFLQFLRSHNLQTRQSHFAFAISRAVKRQMFEWARREGGLNAVGTQDNSEILAAIAVEDPMQRYALLRHFLHRCVSKGLLSDAELELLIQFKLDGNTGQETVASGCVSSNAFRQKMKRLFAKLRRLAR